MNSHGTKRVNRVVAGLLGLIMMLTSLTAIVIPTFALEELTVGARSETSANGDVFLGGNYIELGISKGGSFGTSTSPKSKTFHPNDTKNRLGMVVDNDGWDVGKAPTTGDFFLPGTPEECYILAYRCNGRTYQYRVADQNVQSGTLSWKTPPTAKDASKGDTLRAIVTGETPQGVKLTITYSFGVNDRYYRTKVEIENTAGMDITDVRFVRSFDPDQDQGKTGNYDTYNKVICNPKSSAPAGEENYAMVVARGKDSLEGFFFIAFDNRARASRGVSFAPTSAYLSGLWTDNGALPTYATDASIEMTKSKTNGYTLEDNAIAITFALGTLSAGASDQCEYFSSLHPDVKQSLEDVSAAHTPVISAVEGATLEHGYRSGGPSVTAVADEGHVLSYQWYFNSVASNEGGVLLEGATGASYTVPQKMALGNTVYYYCVVTATRTDNGKTASVTTKPIAVEFLYAEHDFEETVIVEGSCTTSGSVRRDCRVCGYSDIITIPATGHNYGEIVYEKEPDCEHGSRGYKVCASCGYKQTLDYIPALGHSYISRVTRAATCTEDGIVTYTCTRCGDSYEVTTHAEHHYELTVTEAGCYEDGASVYTCSKCGDAYSIAIPAAHDYESKVTKKASADADGEITYTCRKCGNSYTEAIPARKSASVLLVQDGLPWNADSASAQLRALVNDGFLTGWDAATTRELDRLTLTDYDVIYIANDQTTATYSRLSDLNTLLTEYAKAGGVVIYGACDRGWAGGNISDVLPGGVRKINNYSKYNYILDNAHPVVTGGLTDNKALTNELLVGNYCSHTSFDKKTLPDGFHTILQDGAGNPTLVEYPMGEGTVILSGLTWEFYYDRNYTGSTSYAKCVFDDLLVYAAMKGKDVQTCDHAYDKGLTVAPTCTEVGYTLHTCTLCGASYKDQFVEALGHRTGAFTVTVEPDCEHEGLREAVCPECGEKVVETIAALGHTSGEWIVDKEATEFKPGLRHKNCTVCGKVSVETEIPAIGHTWGEIQYQEAPDCEHGAYGFRTCLTCGDSEEVGYIPALGHHYVSKVTRAATCTEDGIVTYTCTHCDKSYTVTTHAEHHYVLTVKAATCIEDGASVYTCSVCGDAYSETIPASHAYEPKVTKKASQTENGEVTYTCIKCGDSYTKMIPARANANVLLVQDNLPWSDDNAADLLLSLCRTGYLTGWDLTTTAGLEAVDLSIYNVIYIANDQTTATYGRLARANELLTEYAKAGGVLVYGACDNGWAGGNISDLLPGGVKKINIYSKYNYILDGTHMIVSGVLTDNRALTNELLVGTYCSHTSFDASSLPEGYHAILEDNRGNPTLVEYPMGEGTVILSGLTWEFYYSRIYQGSTSYSMNVFDDLLVYAAMLSNLTDAETCEHLYADEGLTVSPTCTEVGYTLHTCTKCGASYKDSFVPATGHRMGKPEDTRKADCEHEGERQSACSACGETVTEVIAPLGHDWSEWIIDRAADYDHAGEKHRVCKTCGAESLHAEIPQLVCDHTNAVKDAAVAATCTADGLTEGSHCADCGKVLKAQETVPMLGHDWSEWKVVKEATATVAGSRERSCKTCGKTETETIAKLPESETTGKTTEKTTEANGSGKEYTSVGSLFGCTGAVSASESVVVLVAVLALGGVMMLVKSKKSKKKKDENDKKAE